LVFLDITATPEDRNTMADIVEHVAEQVFMPLTVGGGLRSIEDMRRILVAGADKVSINTAAVLSPELIKDGAEKFGSQCIVVAIDAKRIKNDSPPKWIVHIYSGQEATKVDAIEWAMEATRLGAGEILLTSMDADGHKTGYDIELTRAISEAVRIPVIASGGAGSMEDLERALSRGKADAVLAASIFHYKTHSIHEIKKYLSSKGIPIRA
ncbi:MAG: imidazole glycerol phosphate synthase subunit HisF, partial [Dehalococcoidia bacterium]